MKIEKKERRRKKSPGQNGKIFSAVARPIKQLRLEMTEGDRMTTGNKKVKAWPPGQTVLTDVEQHLFLQRYPLST